ncbi:MAG: pilus assembly protein, partial [Chloroflexi bacterium]|nr:pilus assembly protein [Chloroflexota bacterium]
MRDSERAQSAVEFALVLLFVIIPLMAGIIDGGIMFYKYVAITNTAREAAREGAIYQYPYPGTKDYEEVDAIREAVIYQAIATTQGPLVSIDP